MSVFVGSLPSSCSLSILSSFTPPERGLSKSPHPFPHQLQQQQPKIWLSWHQPPSSPCSHPPSTPPTFSSTRPPSSVKARAWPPFSPRFSSTFFSSDHLSLFTGLRPDLERLGALNPPQFFIKAIHALTFSFHHFSTWHITGRFSYQTLQNFATQPEPYPHYPTLYIL